MNIGEVSKTTGMAVKTIRYYEDIGFLTPQRAANGYRSFSPQDLHKLAFVGRARSLGFTIEDCRKLLELYEDQRRSSADVKRVARDNLLAIEEKIASLKTMHATLSDLVARCAGDDRPDCPILNDMGKDLTAFQK